MSSSSPSKPQVASWIIALLVCSVLSFAIGTWAAKPVAELTQPLFSPTSSTTVSDIGSMPPAGLVDKPGDFKQFWELWKQLKSRYYKQPLDEKKMMYGAMTGLVSSLEDPYTVFFEPKTATEFTQSLQGKFEGIGAEIGIKDNQLQVIAPLPDSPAQRAGLRAGDAILKIDAKDTTDMAVDKAVSLIRGAKGTTVVLSIGRVKVEKDAKGKEKTTPNAQDISIVRDTIVVKSVTVKYRDGIAVLEVSHFNQDTQELFSKAVEEILTKDVKGLVLDLRNDPGGYLDRAIDMVSEWTGDAVVVSERRQGKIVEEYHGTHTARLANMPTMILINQGSASASEIVAGALQDANKGKLIGMKSFGKGSVQDYTELPDHSAVKITIAEWLTPKGRSINKIGIQPDIQIDRTEDDYHANRDPQLDKAIELLTGKAPAALPTTSTTAIPPTK